MTRFRGAVLLTLVLAGCSDSTTVAPDLAPSMDRLEIPAIPSGERMTGNTAMIPIYNMETGGLIYGSTPIGPALWPAKANAQAQSEFYLVVYPIGSTIGTIQCNDVPNETCPDHGPVIAGGAMQINPAVYGNGVLGHDHLSPPHGAGFHVTEYPVLVLFTSAAAANQRISSRAALNAAVTRGDVFLVPFEGFSFVNAIVNARVWAIGTPWVCPAYTLCPRP